MSEPLVTVFKAKNQKPKEQVLTAYCPRCASPLIPLWFFVLVLTIFFFAGILCGWGLRA